MQQLTVYIDALERIKAEGLVLQARAIRMANMADANQFTAACDALLVFDDGDESNTGALVNMESAEAHLKETMQDVLVSESAGEKTEAPPNTERW